MVAEAGLIAVALVGALGSSASVTGFLLEQEVGIVDIDGGNPLAE